MKYVSENFFSIITPEEYACHVLSYIRSHGHLVVVAYHIPTDEERYFDFPFLIYFEGPSVWRGADFRIATKDELVKLLQKLELEVDAFLNDYNLFIVETLAGFKVKIISGRASEIDAPSSNRYLKSESGVD